MRKSIKKIVVFFSKLLVIPVWLLYQIQSLITKEERAFYDYSQLMSLFPGIVGNYLRYGFYKLTLDFLGDDTLICFGVTIASSNTKIGKGVYIGPYCNLGLCVIDDDVLLGTGVHILGGFRQHGIKDLTVPIRKQKGEWTVVHIGKDCWIGNMALIGNDVGDKCVIGAASVVIKPIPEYSIAIGNPAKVIRNRKETADVTQFHESL